MTADQLRYAIHDVLEWNHQWSDASCPWCEAQSYGVDGFGQPADDAVAEFFVVDHEARCAVTLLEAILAERYVYLNPPLPPVVPPPVPPHVMALAGEGTLAGDVLRIKLYLRQIAAAIIDRIIKFFEVWREICQSKES